MDPHVLDQKKKSKNIKYSSFLAARSITWICFFTFSWNDLEMIIISPTLALTHLRRWYDLKFYLNLTISHFKRTHLCSTSFEWLKANSICWKFLPKDKWVLRKFFPKIIEYFNLLIDLVWQSNIDVENVSYAVTWNTPSFLCGGKE